MHALIVGAGIVGLATARALTERGWTVTVVDRGPIPNPHASSFDHHRLIRHHYPDQMGYARRIPEAFAAWARLWSDLGERHYVETGIVGLSRADGDWTDRCLPMMRELGVEHEVLDPVAMAMRLPFVNAAGVRFALFTREGGALMAEAILDGLVRLLGERGAELRADTAVAAIDGEGGSVVTDSGERLTADRVIVAAGVGAAKLAFPGKPELVPYRTTILYADPPEDLASFWEGAPSWVDLGTDEELWGMPPVAGLPLKLGAGERSRGGDPDTERGTLPEDVAGVLASYGGRFHGIERFSVRSAPTNFWTMAPQERFVLLRDGRALFVSACSGHGFKFGALTGEDVAAAVDGADFDALATRLAGRAA
jgi:glycine/D-amino acid oxidase-like deaminating enzyme